MESIVTLKIKSYEGPIQNNIISLDGPYRNRMRFAKKALDHADKNFPSEILFRQAIKSVEDHKFLIEGYEFYFRDGPRASNGDYISFNGSRGVISFSKTTFTRSPLNHLNVGDDSAELNGIQVKKNGDRLFTLKINGDKNWLKNDITVTLYNNTNQCLVELFDARTLKRWISFKGYIYPLEE